MGRAGVDGRRRHLGGRVGVPDGGDHPGSHRRLDHPGRAGQFRCQGDDPQVSRTRRPQALERGHVRSDQVPWILGAAPGRGKERSLQVKASQDAVVGQAGQQRGPGLELGERRGHQAGHDARGAVPAVKLRRVPGVVA